VVQAKSDIGQSFIGPFLQRCEELWDATLLRPVTAAGRAVDERSIDAASQTPIAILDTASQPSSHAERKKRTAQLSTAEKLDRLRAIRRDHLNPKRVSITFTAACNLVPIDTKTVNAHAPELRQHWDDPTYIG
jgi:hypothetical protein